MLRILAVALVVILGGCVTNSLNERYGSGDIELSRAFNSKFAEYLDGNPLAFAVTADGYTSYSYYFCPEARCEISDYGWRAINDCEKQSKGAECSIYAVRDNIVWRGADGNNAGTIWSDLPAVTTLPSAQSEIPLDEKSRATIRKYNEAMKGNSRLHGALAVSLNNRVVYAFYAYKNPEQSKKLSAHDAIWFCERETGQECRLLALDRNSVIDGASIETMLGNESVSTGTSTGQGIGGRSARASDVRSLAVLWEGNPAPQAGTIDLISGAIAFNGHNEATCTRVSENTQSLTWRVECSDGTTVEGVYKGLGDGKGSTGVGLDQNGKSVTFTVGPRIQ